MIYTSIKEYINNKYIYNQSALSKSKHPTTSLLNEIHVE